MTKLHLRQPGFTYSTCGPFTLYCERIQKFRQTFDLKDLYKNELDQDFLFIIQHILIVKI